MAKVRMYGINNRNTVANTSNSKEAVLFRKKQSRKSGKAIPQKKGNGCVKCV
jgi:hypothetical protein